jgi:hypothetical protein
LKVARSVKSVDRLFELVSLLALVSLGVGLRLIFVSKFPTIPISDFRSIVFFGQYLEKHGLFSDGWFWQYHSPGVPLILCALFRLFPAADADSLARGATALVCGLLPIIPFLIWRGIFPLWLRFATGLSLALWPGQILFSGVVAHDNWILVPTVALAALAVRWGRARPLPVAAGLLFASAVIIRQEMLVPLIPLVFLAAGASTRRNLLILSLSAGLPLLAGGAYRKACTGRFALTTEHGGLSMLGAYVPGATATGWLDPFAFIASVRPDLLSDRKQLLKQAPLLAAQQLRRRPVFHIARFASAILSNSLAGESDSLPWALNPDVMPAYKAPYGAALIVRLNHPLHFEMVVIQGLFLAVVFFAVRRRHVILLALALAVALKYGIHAITVSQPRYVLVATALEIIAIWIGVDEILAPGVRQALRSGLPKLLLVAAVFAAALTLIAPPLQDVVRRHDIETQRTYQFPLVLTDRSASLSCTVSQGLLSSLILSELSTPSATIQTLSKDPKPGEKAVAQCQLTGSGGPGGVALQVLDAYPTGGLADRMVQRVTVDGAEVFTHDIGREPGTGWATIPIGPVDAHSQRSVSIQIEAVRPEPGYDWGDAAVTTFRLIALH